MTSKNPFIAGMEHDSIGWPHDPEDQDMADALREHPIEEDA